ncbi:MAG TPA: hypothetical protein VGP18_13740 [Solirubrobacteraceae bacterium]|nr:hypothetical protein [Solirubrobacteraceae bacterium]
MASDALSAHLQNFYLVCGTAIPVLFVAVVVQPRADKGGGALPFKTFYWVYGLFVMLLGEGAAMAGLLLDATPLWLQLWSATGVLVGMLSAVTLSVLSAETTDNATDGLA